MTKKWENHEKDTAKKFNRSPIVGSGRIPTMKGDVKTANFLFENKQTDSDSYILKKSIWNKIKKEAETDRKIAAMCLDINTEKLVVLSLNDFLSLVQSASSSSDNYDSDFSEDIVFSAKDKVIHLALSVNNDRKFNTYCNDTVERENVTTDEKKITCNLCKVRLKKVNKK